MVAKKPHEVSVITNMHCDSMVNNKQTQLLMTASRTGTPNMNGTSTQTNST